MAKDKMEKEISEDEAEVAGRGKIQYTKLIDDRRIV